MARTNIPVVEAAYNAGVEIAAANVVATADAGEYEIDIDGVQAHRLLVVFTAAANDGLAYAVKAGAFSDASLGDLSITVADGGTFCTVVESARFKQSDGKLYIDAANVGLAATGTVTAYKLP
jgi:hypothetical protein